MSTLDHAFIRAYTAGVRGPQAAGSETAPDLTATATIVSTPQAPVEDAGQDNMSAMTKPPRPHFLRAAAKPTISNSIVPPPHFSLESFTHTVTSLDVAPEETPISTAAAVSVRIDPPQSLSPARAAKFIAGNEDAPTAAPVIAAKEPAVVGRAAQPVRLEATRLDEASPSSDIKPDGLAARPTFEVDRFAWPEICNHWMRRAAEPVDQLAQQLLAEASLGRKIIAITGTARGEGRTALTLLLARRMAATGAKVLAVDADFNSPQLASRLGMAIESGWEQSLAAPDVSPWDTMIESLDDRLTVAPLAPRTRLNVTAEVAQRAAQMLNELQARFDVVLVDAGPLLAPAEETPELQGLFAAAGSFGAAVLVADTRADDRQRLVALSRRLLDANIAPLGVAENFCSE
jgi:Mrp family chromosome partitioning ATPase